MLVHISVMNYICPFIKQTKLMILFKNRHKSWEIKAVSTEVMSHYLKTVLVVVLFAKVQGVVMFESPSTSRVRGLSDFTSPRTFVKRTSAKTVHPV